MLSQLHFVFGILHATLSSPAFYGVRWQGGFTESTKLILSHYPHIFSSGKTGNQSSLVIGNGGSFQISTATAVPEPGHYAFLSLLTGTVIFVAYRRRKKEATA